MAGLILASTPIDAAEATGEASAAAEIAAPFQPPEEPMLLTRTVRKPLSGGQQILAKRSYEIRFVRDGDGFRIDGKLIDITVEVPPRLDAIAQIERERPDDGLFPLRLDANGKLIARGLPPAPTPTAHKLIDAVAAQVDRLPLRPIDKTQAQAFVAAFHERPGYSIWPETLFRPAPGLHREERLLPLPDGVRGRLITATDARAVGTSGLMLSFDRTVTTELDGVARTTYERWTLVKR